MDVLEAIRTRRSIRRYEPDPIPKEKLELLLEAARLSPSAGNRQPWRFIVVRDAELKRKLATECAWERLSPMRQVETARVVIVGCGLPAESIPVGSFDGYVVDVIIALQSVILAATSLGLGTCWIGAFYEERVREVLGIPEDVRVIALLTVGVPAESPAAKPRKELREIAYGERYGAGLDI